ncbi:MAG: outer membrane lipoprotein carrier protein LolA, partial [Rubrivivax sp.]|nr:outer membrane lipoprotein carrier protein LolA [Rubrivivax sp.]
MTSGSRIDRRAAAALLLALPAALRAQGLELATLMRRMAQRPSGQARFSEERTVSGIDGPLRSSGTLTFTAPDRFARH